MMANHRLGLHWLRYHANDQIDFAHVEKMQYPSVKPFEWMWNSASFCKNLLATMPQDAYILARDHPLSEQKQDMWVDPVGTGQRHANEWSEKVRSGQYRLPIDRTFFLGINEPDATSGDRIAIDRYNEAFLVRLQQHGLRGGAFNFSTGHPRTVDGTPHTPPDYSVFESTHAAIVRGHHIAVLHIYGSAQMPLVPGHFDRLRACPWQDVTWVVGECAIDQHVTSGGRHDGYKGLLSGEEYCRWLDTLIMGVGDSRIHSWQVFTYDFSHPWATFDIVPIRVALENYPWQHGAPAVNPPPPPAVKPQPATTTQMYVDSPDGLQVRVGPGVSYPRVHGLEHGAPVQVYETRPGEDGRLWARVGAGWAAHWLLSDTEPEPVPVAPHPPQVGPSVPVTPAQPQDKWERSYAFTARWEGGYQNVHNDRGNWTGGQVGVGELKGTNWGISAASYPHLDIKNLTKEQAKAIYFRDYWQASGADKLDWPACLIVFDTAVLHGVGRARQWVQEAGTNPLHFAARRLRSYVVLDNWHFWGAAWTRRVADLLEEAAK